MLLAQHAILMRRLSQITGHISRLESANASRRCEHLEELVTGPAVLPDREAILHSSVQSLREQSAAVCDLSTLWEHSLGLRRAIDRLSQAASLTTPDSINEISARIDHVGKLILLNRDGAALPSLLEGKAALISIDDDIKDLAGLNSDLRALCAATIDRSGTIMGRLAALSRAISDAQGTGAALASKVAAASAAHDGEPD
jgi:hypothetical protein